LGTAIARVAERQTRKAQDLVSASSWGFKSPLSHQFRIGPTVARSLVRRRRRFSRGLVAGLLGGTVALRHILDAAAYGRRDLGVGAA
jgi:hypothetical protein